MHKSHAHVWLQMMMGCALLFLVLAFLIRIPIIRCLDNRIVQALDPVRTEPLIAFLHQVTALGSARILIAMMILPMAYLIYRKRYAAFFLLPGVFWAEHGLNTFLKKWIARGRPDFPQLVHETGYSFPSGHAMNASAVYGLLIFLIAPLIQTKWIRVLWVACGLTLILLIGFSRLFLRVHFLTDVLAGYCAGGLFVALSAFVLICIDRRRRHD